MGAGRPRLVKDAAFAGEKVRGSGSVRPMTTMPKLTAVLAAILMIAAACGEQDSAGRGSDGGGGDAAACPDEPVKLDSGLVYEDVECGDGEAAEAGDTLVVHYTGTLEDGAEFDSSRGGDPLPFQLGAGNVIAGWDQGLVGMKEGGLRKLVIPPELGYGETGAGPIPPNSTLLFEVELLEIQAPAG